MFERDCARCGVHYRGLGRSFCSNACRFLASRNRIQFACKNCGLDCVRPASHAKHHAADFCSPKCWYAFAKGKELTGKIAITDLICLHCHKQFTGRPMPHERRFCSTKCQHAGRPQCPKRRVARIQVDCGECGRPFHTLACKQVAGRGRFCSRACLAKHVNSIRTITRPSKIETCFFDQCERGGVQLDRQVRIGRYSIDAATPDKSIAFEFDGHYWHSRPGSVARDERKSRFLAEIGVKLVRIPEALYRTNPDAAVNMVLSAIPGI
jgi:very-short-patch-repair endonuclease